MRFAQLRTEGIELRLVLRVAHAGREERVGTVGRISSGVGQEEVARQVEARGLVVLLVGDRALHPVGHVAVAPGDQADIHIAARHLVRRDAPPTPVPSIP